MRQKSRLATLFCLAVAFCVLTVAAQAELGTVRGTLSVAGTSEPIAGAQITLMVPVNTAPFSIGQAGQSAASSDKAGHFALNGVQPGRYFIQVQYEGYVLTGQSNVAVARGQAVDVALTMVRGAVISGRVRDPKGQPLSDVTVRAFTLAYRNDVPTLIPIAEKTTDDRGEYRLFWLLPGDYYVAAVPRAPVRGAKGLQNVRTFYPRSENASNAMALAAAPGAQIENIDIDVATAQLHKVAGKVSSTASPAPPPADAQGVFAIIANTQNHTAQVLLVRDEGSITRDGDIPTVTAPAIGTVSGGQFEFTNVLPGSYEVLALVNDRNSYPAIGRTHVEVRNQDISGLSLQAHPGVELHGAMFVDGHPPGTPGLQVMLQPDGPLTNIGFLTQEDVRTDGNFTISNVPEGHFRVAVFPQSQADLYVDDIRQGSLSVYDTGFDVGADAPAPVQVILSSHGGTLEGTTSPGAQVALVPSTRRENHALYYGRTADAMGNFVLHGIAPGEYKLYAWQNAPAGAYHNTTFLQKYELEAKTVVIAPDSKIRLDVIAR